MDIDTGVRVSHPFFGKGVCSGPVNPNNKTIMVTFDAGNKCMFPVPVADLEPIVRRPLFAL